MKLSKSLMAAAAIALVPLASIAGDMDKKPAPMGTEKSAQFDTLDANRDGRISREEAAVDSKIVFSSADKNGDGYLDSMEYKNSGKMHDKMEGEGSMSSPDASKPKPKY